MNLRAVPESKFLLKYLLIALGLLGFAALSVYDGFVKYPAGIPRLEAWEKLSAEIQSNPRLGEEDRVEKWEELAEQEGFSKRIPEEEETSEALRSKIVYQYVFIALGILIGLPMLAKYFMDKESWIESTEDSLKGSWGQEMKIADINQFNKEKWDKKGIGVFHYKTQDGISRTFVVDDLKYNRQTTDKIVQWVESQIPREMIVGGEPEPIPRMENDDGDDSDV
jgi:hypothetical protein